MNKFKKLYFFSAAYPYGIGESWKESELEVLSKKFEEIVIIPLNGRGSIKKKKELPENVVATQPIFKYPLKFKGYKDISYLFNINAFYFFKEFFRRKVFFKKSKIVKWLLTIKRIGI